MTEHLRLSIDESQSGTSDELVVVGLTVTSVGDERLRVGGNEEGDGSVDVGNNTLIDRESDRVGFSTDEHLAEQALSDPNQNL